MICRICGADNLSEFYRLRDYPLAAGPTVHKGASPVRTCDIAIGYCLQCETCTAISPDPAEIEYGEEYTSSNAGRPLDGRSWDFLEFIGRTGIYAGNKVLEIGCYDGLLMQRIKQAFGAEVCGCDPCSRVASVVAKDQELNIKGAYFSSSLYERDYFGAVVFRNVLEHVAFPRLWLQDVQKVLKPGGHIVLEVPDGEGRIADCVHGSVVPEHASYFGVESLASLLSDFRSVTIQRFTGGLRAEAAKPAAGGMPGEKLAFGHLSAAERYRRLISGSQKAILERSRIAQLLSSMEDIYFFGANTCTLELLVTGAAPSSKVRFAVDDDQYKIGECLVNYGIPVRSREAVREVPPGSCFVISSYSYHDVLYEYLDGNLPRPCRILRLHPRVELVEVGLK